MAVAKGGDYVSIQNLSNKKVSVKFNGWMFIYDGTIQPFVESKEEEKVSSQNHSLKCPVCLNEDNPDLRYLPCHHYFCNDCFPGLWMRHDSEIVDNPYGIRCPLCKERYVFLFRNDGDLEIYSHEIAPYFSFPKLTQDIEANDWFSKRLCISCTSHYNGCYIFNKDERHEPKIYRDRCGCLFPICASVLDKRLHVLSIEFWKIKCVSLMATNNTAIPELQKHFTIKYLFQVIEICFAYLGKNYFHK